MTSERRTWDQMQRDNPGAAWIKGGEFCPEFQRTSASDAVNVLLQEERDAGYKEWQIVGFNGCWSCDHCNKCNHLHDPQRPK